MIDSSRRRRPANSRSSRVIAFVVGLLMIAGATAAAIAYRHVSLAMAADPVCVTTLSLDTPSRKGSTCVVYAATVVRAYTKRGSKSSTDVLRLATPDETFAIALCCRGTAVFRGAFAGEPVTVESVDGRPAFVATRDGAVSTTADPSSLRTIALILGPIGVLAVTISSFGGGLARFVMRRSGRR